MKGYSIGISYSSWFGFKCGFHEDKDIPLVMASRSSISRQEYYMIKILRV
jgi:hypothetical protein